MRTTQGTIFGVLLIAVGACFTLILASETPPDLSSKIRQIALDQSNIKLNERSGEIAPRVNEWGDELVQDMKPKQTIPPSQAPVGTTPPWEQDFEVVPKALNGQSTGYTEFNGELDNGKSVSNGSLDSDSDAKGLAGQKESGNLLKYAPIAKETHQKPVTDRKQQIVSGYAPGEPMLANNGHSEFTVDNTSGGGDAIAKLYRNSEYPAVRTFFVSQGESFTASNLQSGVYVLRYRYINNEATYESDRAFKLVEITEPDGVRYSDVRVTLYTVSNGNLKNKLVPSAKF